MSHHAVMSLEGLVLGPRRLQTEGLPPMCAPLPDHNQALVWTQAQAPCVEPTERGDPRAAWVLNSPIQGTFRQANVVRGELHSSRCHAWRPLGACAPSPWSGGSR